jgi:uroporphyrinogen-III synthase
VTSLLGFVDPPDAPPVVVCIGPVTAAAAREAGLAVTIEAAVHDASGLVASIVEHFAPAASR